ncbi:MAG: hypothetical protein COX17_01595 [Deltaproteobacteria bacterium CG23_combo_of_CG06-09_8_20_14_all_60_8]|nr:MAG: hypothetical protein AUK28_02000 [Desulfobacterales bacterium CG2_30_60_27]PIP44401.1 MAG: hypothetical protein COX17_01595 [Deltaproteobacteria bacterium CG23_combo_of_CG06-09_8_20_14_all_60_8]
METGVKLPRFILAALIICMLAGCAPRIQGLSQEVYRDPDFVIDLVNHGGLALLPVIVLEQPSDVKQAGNPQIPAAPYTSPTPPSEADKAEYERRADGRDAYRILLSKILMSSMQGRRGAMRLVSPFDALKILNDQEMTANYRAFTRDFPRVGFNQETLHRFGQALACRYLFISQAVVSEAKPEVSLTIIWTFGQRTMMRSIMMAGQIWDTETGKQVWEGSWIGYNRLHAYQSSPLDEELAQQAVESLIERLMN